ncbi:MFS transporter [Vibrio olivae]
MISLGSSEYHKVTLSLALGSFLVFCNLYLFQPMLPTMAAHFSLSETQVNWVFAAATLALSVSLVPWAVSSESFGRRRVMLIGLCDANDWRVNAAYQSILDHRGLPRINGDCDRRFCFCCRGLYG